VPALRRLVALLSVTATASLALGVAGGSSDAVVPGPNGRIAFVRESLGNADTFKIIAANPKGTKEVVLAGTYHRDDFVEHFITNWSPIGRRAAFMVDLGIWLVRADGTHLHKIFQGSRKVGMDDGPTFTPNGKHIVFARCCKIGGDAGQTLWKIKPDGTGLTRITREPAPPGGGEGGIESTPQVSPDGSQIVFNRCAKAGCAITTVAINGTHRHRLTDPTLFGTRVPIWSPDSSRIVFTAARGTATHIMSIRRNGTGLKQLTHGRKEFSSDASYAPNGRKIIFTRFTSTGALDLFTMRPNGRGVTRLTRTPAAEAYPQWAVARSS
jgi:TolB protein